MSDVHPNIKLSILNAELELWKNTAYQNEVRLRAAKKAGHEIYADKAMEELVVAEKMIDAVKAEMEEISKQVKL